MARKSFSADERRLSDHVTLGVVTTAVPVETVDAVLRDTGCATWRARQLAPRLMVYYVMALALYAHLSYDAVLRELVEGLRWLRRDAQQPDGHPPDAQHRDAPCRDGDPIRLAGKSAITQARQRLGTGPLRLLFERVARPLARAHTPAAWYRDLRLVSVDGTTLNAPDAPEVARRFGRPAAGRGVSAFPQVRLLTLVETGTHAVFAAAFGAFATSEVALMRQVLPRLTPGMLCLADRGFIGYALWRDAAATGAALLWRVRASEVLACRERLADGSYLSRLYPSSACRQRDCLGLDVRVIEYTLPGVPGSGETVYRLITTLLDPNSAPAAEVAALYHERWEHEGLLRELKVTLPGRPLLLRSCCPDLIEQEIYGLLLTHFAIRKLMLEASGPQGDPDALSFLGAVRVIRRNLPLYAAFPP